MMFGQPQFLPLLALASLPLLIHLLARRQRRIVKFSMTRFLQEVTQQTHGRRWLRELLILLLRTGVVLFTLLALVRPYAPIPLPLPPAPTSIVLILDNSLSMQSGARDGQVWFERALKWCERAIRELPTEIALLTAEKASDPICEFTSDLQRLTQALKQVQPTFKALDLTPTLQTADILLSHRPAAVKRIVVITDLQSEPLRSLHLPKLSNPLTVVDVKPYEKVSNARLNAKLILPLDPNSEGSVVVELQNLSRQSLKGRIRASIYKKTFAQTEVSLQPQGRKALSLRLPSWVLDAADERGLVQVEVRWESELDIFGWDDFVRFEFRSPKRIRVVNAVRQGRQFVNAALRATNLVPISTANLRDADVIISSAPNDTKTAKELADWISQGKVAIVTADSVVSPFWAMIGASAQQIRSSKKLRVRWVNETNPILRGLGSSLQLVTAQPILKFGNGNSNLKVLVDLTDGTPLLVESTVGSRRCFIFTTPFNPQHTTLIYSPAFVPLLYRLVRFAAHDQELSTTESKTEPKAMNKHSTIVPKSESNFILPSHGEVTNTLKEVSGSIVTLNQPPYALLAETNLRDLTNLCLLLALLCLLTESLLTAIWWRRAR